MDRISNPEAFTTAPLYDSEFSENVRQDLAQAQASVYNLPALSRSAQSLEGSHNLPKQPPREGVVSNAAAMEELARTQSGSTSSSDDLDPFSSESPTHKSMPEFMSDSFYLVDRPGGLHSPMEVLGTPGSIAHMASNNPSVQYARGEMERAPLEG